MLIAFLIACKKYPENRLWFKKPEKAFTKGKVTYFKVDGVDSIPLINSTWGDDITSKEFNLSSYENYYLIGGSYFQGTFEFHSDKTVLFVIDKYGAPPLYNPFRLQGPWQILKLTKKGTLKLKREVNGKTFEMQFN